METRFGYEQPAQSMEASEQQAFRMSSKTLAGPADTGFVHDFSRVRIHTDQRATQSAKAVNAKAYTVGNNIVFGESYYSPNTTGGNRLIAHELAHVFQQSVTGPRLACDKLDLKKVDDELFWGDPLTQDHGEVGLGASTASPKGDAKLPIEAYVYPRNVLDPMPIVGLNPAQKPAADSKSEGDTKLTGEAKSPSARSVIPDRPKESQWRFNPEGLLVPARRALVVAGIHGDEQGPRDIVKQLQKELSDGSNPLARDFDTIVIPDANPGGFQKKTRENLVGVDLNRNFPGLKGFPAAKGTVPKLQPETEAIMAVVQTIKPDRIISLHAIEDPAGKKGGVYADPYKDDDVTKLACRMASRMRGQTGKDEINVSGNKLDTGFCKALYPLSGEVSVTDKQSSLGSWASAPKNVGGEATPVITHEVSSKKKPDSLPQNGSARSVETIMPGIREFLLDNEHLPSEADEFLRQAISDTFLTGEKDSPDKTRDIIVAMVKTHFEDMNKYYEKVWRPQQPASALKALPASLRVQNDFRSFNRQAGITGAALAKEPLFKVSGTDDEIKQAIFHVMQTISLPGFSRHAWGTEIDLDPPVRTEWEGSGSKVSVIPFLTAEAAKFGFYHPYSDKRLSAVLPHYENEPWHLSFWSIAKTLQEEYMKRITGAVLDNLIGRTAKAIGGKIDQKRLKGILTGMNLTSFQSNVAPPPK